MKLFLTSSGISHENEKEFRELLGKDPAGLKVAFIPTAANGELGEFLTTIITQNIPSWFIKDRDILNYLKMDVSFINLEELNESNVIETFAPYDVILMYGGNTFFLMYHINRSGFRKYIDEILKDKVYVGVSAGSIVAGPDISLAGWGGADANNIGLTDTSGLGLINFTIQPHWKGNKFEEAKDYPFEVKYLKDGQALAII